MNILETLEYAKKMHAMTNEFDKTKTIPYYWHLLRVMLRVKEPTEDQQKIAILHDVLEDTPATEKELRHLFGNHVTDNVIWCSKNFFKELSFKQWMKKIGLEAPEDAILVKLADISDNLGFERMRGLMPNNDGFKRPLKIKIDNDVQKKINKSVNKKMRLSGEMGAFDRYYIGWNLIMENSKNLELIKQIETTDFININQLKKLSQYIPEEELLNYFSYNKLNTWKISGETKIHYDKNNQAYLAAEVDVAIGRLYQSFLNKEIDPQYINNQIARDKNSFHVTLINVSDMNKIKKDFNENKISEMIESFKINEDGFFSYGIGKATKDNSNTFYVVLENAYIDTLRESLGLRKHDLHMTVGFLPKDVHGIKKDRSTIEFSNKELWKHFVSCNFKNEEVKSFKIKF